MSKRSNAASIRARRAEWAINDRMPHADEPLFSSNRHCNMKHRQLPDKIIIRLITCQLQTLVVCLLIYSPPRRLQFQRCCRCVPSHSAETRVLAGGRNSYLSEMRFQLFNYAVCNVYTNSCHKHRHWSVEINSVE